MAPLLANPLAMAANDVDAAAPLPQQLSDLMYVSAPRRRRGTTQCPGAVGCCAACARPHSIPVRLTACPRAPHLTHPRCRAWLT